jgi:hypothetical protein
VNEFTDFPIHVIRALYIDVSLYLTLTIQASSRLKRSANHLWNNSDVCRKKFGEWSPLTMYYTILMNDHGDAMINMYTPGDRFTKVIVNVRFTKLVLNLRVTTYDLRHVTSPIMEVKRYYIVSYIFYIINPTAQQLIRVAEWVRSLDLTTRTSLSPIRSGFAPGFVNYKKGALDSQPI